MKKKYLKFAAFAIMTALPACTSEVIEVSNPDTPSSNLTLGPGEDIVRINLTNTVSTRAARPISNSAPDNNINRIAFKFLTSGGSEVDGITIENVVDETTEKPLESSSFVVDQDNNVLKINGDLDPEKDGTIETISIKFSGLENGANKSLNIIAYGYNNESEENGFPYENETNKIEIGQKGNSGNYLLKCDGINTAIQEIFSGATEKYIGVNQHGKFEEVPQITMKRQVAALLAYFKDAPVFVNNEKVEKITVSTKYQATGFYFPAALLGADKDAFNGIGQATTNGSWVHYLTFDMSGASNYKDNHTSGDTYEFMSIGGSNNDGSNFLLAEGMTEIEGLECQDNTLFGSCFLLPFHSRQDLSVGNYNCATLNICYWKKTGDNTYELITSIPLKKGTKTEGESLDGTDAYQYSIRCNNFYSIGTKKTTGLPETGGDDPDDPDDPDDDNPASIDEPTGWDHATVSIEEDYADSNELFN